MTVEATIQSLLEESRKLQQLGEENQATKNAVAAEPMQKMDGASAEDEPSNKKNAVTDQKAAEGGTSKKPNEATKGAVAPESMEKMAKESEEVSDEEVVVEEEIVSYDMSEDVAALFNGEEGLTEDFRSKAETIFEAAVTSRIKTEVARIAEELEAQYEAKLQEELENSVEGLIEHVDGYLNLMVEQWMENNAVALETGLKSDILESFVGGLKSLFEEHYIDVPEEKFDVLGSMETEIKQLNAKLNEAVELNIALNKQVSEQRRIEVVAEACEGLSDIESEKLQALAEEITFEDVNSFAKKIQTIRENYFAKKATKEDTPSILAEETIQEETSVPAEMQSYVKTLSTLLR